MESSVYSFTPVFFEVFNGILKLFLLFHMNIVPLLGLFHMLFCINPPCNTKYKKSFLAFVKILYAFLMFTLVIYSMRLWGEPITIYNLDKVYLLLSIIPYFTMGIFKSKHN